MGQAQAEDWRLDPEALAGAAGAAVTEIGVFPIKDNVIIETLLEGDFYEGSVIFIPDAYKRKWQRGRVVAIGAGRVLADGTRVRPDVKLGDVVGYTGEWQGEEFKLDGRTYRGLENEQIAFVLEA